MRIAAVTDDGTTISQHFGRAAHYSVLTVEDGEITKRELRDKVGHSHFASREQGQTTGTAHGTSPEAQSRHTQMIDAIRDCQVLLARGMGWGARQSLAEAGIEAILTDHEDITGAVQAYLLGKLADHPELLH